jgi:hypothetical protein
VSRQRDAPGYMAQVQLTPAADAPNLAYVVVVF